MNYGAFIYKSDLFSSYELVQIKELAAQANKLRSPIADAGNYAGLEWHKFSLDQNLPYVKKILNDKIEDLHKLAKTLLLYETLTGDEIRDLILHGKAVERSDEKDLKEEDKSSALGSMGLKPKIVH